MSFLTPVLLFGGIGVLIPIIIHLLNRQSKKMVEWGAMDFLLDSLAVRSRRIQLEEGLLMVSRCLLITSLVLALARPFIPAGASIPWLFILPPVFIAIICLVVGVVLHERKVLRWLLIIASIILLGLTYAIWQLENRLNLSRFNPSARQDIALIIDGSTSMMMERDGVSNFERAIEKARTIIKRAPREHAFSIILAGPSPIEKILQPTTDRLELDAVLQALKPLDGAMSAYHALTSAALSLAKGDNPLKQIILFSDTQDVGWDIGEEDRWGFLNKAFKNLESEPQIMIVEMPLPQYIRNLAVVDIRLSRKIVGIDRDVEIAVTVENTGNEAVTPGAMTVTFDGAQTYKSKSLGQIQPGEQQTVLISHQFNKSGAHAIQASLEVVDDIVQDNTGVSAINIADSIKVLLIDGQGSTDYLQRAASFPALALAPSSGTLSASSEKQNFLVAPQVVSLSELNDLAGLSEFDVVVLADVVRLPQSTCDQISDFVKRGGGLLVAAGENVDPEFYQDWHWRDDRMLMPAKLGVIKFKQGEQGFNLSLKTLVHPALEKLVDPAKSDLGQAQFSYFRQQLLSKDSINQVSVGGRLDNGDILVTSKQVGLGNVILLGVSLDTRSGNLVTRQSFVPLMHELVYSLANPAAYDLNLLPGWEVDLVLHANNEIKVGQGLKGEYFASVDSSKPVLTRQDSSLQWNWGQGSPCAGVPVDKFKVRWSGKIKAPDSGTYRFTVDADDSIQLSIGRKSFTQVISGAKRILSIKMNANKWYDFEAVLKEEFGDCKAELFWESDDIRRQIVPPNAFRTFSTPIATGSDTEVVQYVVEDSEGAKTSAKLRLSDAGIVFHLEGDISSGLHRLLIPEKHRDYYSDYLIENSNSVPFTVKRNVLESYLTKLAAADYEFVNQYATVSKPQTLEEIIGFLRGNQFGHELGTFLLVSALFFLVVELLLSRWISKSRRLGEGNQIKFDYQQGPSSEFQKQLKKLGKFSSTK